MYRGYNVSPLIFVLIVVALVPSPALARENSSEMRKFLLTIPNLLLSQVSIGVVPSVSSVAGGKVIITGPKRCKEPPKGKVQKVSGVQSGEVDCVNGCKYDVKVKKQGGVEVKAEDTCAKLQGEAKKKCEKSKPGEVNTGARVEKCPGGKLPSLGGPSNSESLLKTVSATKGTTVVEFKNFPFRGSPTSPLLDSFDLGNIGPVKPTPIPETKPQSLPIPVCGAKNPFSFLNSKCRGGW